ncbi:hypothetical protein [Actinophytocola sp.]|uniref:hypothetical protein n=1 Tax=Actinophytocola sp. TaxID=1872138 RepID=UPI002D8039CA|nr:hypothetical protein [Actinophytocola sp.]HET9142439.1 hypothetical protein [Actinophytocola sp.]
MSAKPRWVLPVVLLAMIATVSAGIVARQLYFDPDSSPVAVLPSENQVPPDEQPGPATVEATKDAADHPLYDDLRGVLQAYFDAINTRNYDQWRHVVTAGRVKEEPERKWRESYESTRDGTIVMWRIETGANDSARVLLSFTSTQNEDKAPIELPLGCLRWRLIWAFVVEDGAWKIDVGETNFIPQHQGC